MIDDSTIIRRRPDLITAEVGEESVVLDGDTGMFLQLNSSAARIWALIEQPRSVGALCAALVAQHDVSLDQCRADVTAFVGTIGEQGLIETGG